MRTQAYRSCRSYRLAGVLTLASLAAGLSGCWMPPSAAVRPHGKPRVIADGIQVERVQGLARVKEVLTVYVAPIRSHDARVLVVDPGYRLLTVQYPNGSTETFKVGLHTPMTGIEPGDSVAIHPAEVAEPRVR